MVYVKVITWSGGICLIYTHEPEGECVYIRQIPTDHVISIILHFRHSKICPNLMQKSRSLYIVMGIRCDCGTLFYRCHDVLAW